MGIFGTEHGAAIGSHTGRERQGERIAAPLHAPQSPGDPRTATPAPPPATLTDAEGIRVAFQARGPAAAVPGADPASPEPAPGSWLSGQDLARWHAMAPQRAALFLAGRRLLQLMMADSAGTGQVVIASRCPRCGGDHGPPQIVGAPFLASLSYAGDTVIAAIAPRGSVTALGIDIEADTPAARQRTAALGPLFAPDPAPSLGEWTAIEAVLKADGRGLNVAPSSVRMLGSRARIDGTPRATAAGARTGGATGACATAGTSGVTGTSGDSTVYQVRRVATAPGYIATVAWA